MTAAPRAEQQPDTTAATPEQAEQLARSKSARKRQARKARDKQQRQQQQANGPATMSSADMDADTTADPMTAQEHQTAVPAATNAATEASTAPNSARSDVSMQSAAAMPEVVASPSSQSDTATTAGRQQLVLYLIYNHLCC